MLSASVFVLLAGQAASAKPLYFTTYQFWDRSEPATNGAQDKRWLGHTNLAVTPEMVPTSIRRKVGKGEVIVTLTMPADGAPGNCKPVEGDQAVAKEICEILSVPERLPVSYGAPGRPVSKEWRISFNWDTPIAAAGPARLSTAGLFPTTPPLNADGQWPPFASEGNIQLETMPAPLALIHAFQQAEALKARGFVGAYAQIKPQDKAVGCVVGASSGNSQIDRIACDLVRNIGFSFVRPLMATSGVYNKPVKVEFTKQGIKVRVPNLEPKLGATMIGQPVFTASERTKIAALRTTPHSYSVRLRVLPTGATTECRIESGWLANDIDKLICPVVQRQKFLPQRDVFGDPTSSLTYVDVSVGT